MWLVLLTLTASNWLLMELRVWDVPIDRRTLASAILLVALGKVRLIVRWFMEVRDAPRPLGWIMDAWLVGTAVSLAIQLWLPAATRAAG